MISSKGSRVRQKCKSWVRSRAAANYGRSERASCSAMNLGIAAAQYCNPVLQPSIAVLLEKCIAILRYRPLQLEKSGQEPVSGFNLPSGRCPLPSPHLCTIVHVSIATAVANVVFSIGILRSCLLLY